MKAILLLLMALGCVSCSLDPFLYNETPLKRYDIPTDVIPPSQQAMYTFSSEGHTIYGFWVFPPDSLAMGYTVLYCHGNKDNIGEYWDRVELLYQLGLRVFIFDYRGFGRSEGTPSVSGLYADGRAALAFLRDSLAVDTTTLIFYGYSLGNVVSIDLAARVQSPFRLVAEAPFASAEALFREATPLDLPGSFVLDEAADNVTRIREIHTPLLLMHGAADDFVPWADNGRVVYENAPEPKHLVLVPRANHTDIPYVLTTAGYDSVLLRFIYLGAW
jgi:uncharacterized protein